MKIIKIKGKNYSGFTFSPEGEEFEEGGKIFQKTLNGAWLMDGEEIPRVSGIASGTPYGARFESEALEKGRFVHELVERGEEGKYASSIAKNMEKEVAFIFIGEYESKTVVYSGRADFVRVGDLVQDLKTGKITYGTYIKQLLGYCIAFNCPNADLIYSQEIKGREFVSQERIRGILDNSDLFFEAYFEYLEKCQLYKDSVNDKGEVILNNMPQSEMRTKIERLIKVSLIEKDIKAKFDTKDLKEEVKNFLKAENNGVVRLFGDSGEEIMYGSLSRSDAFLTKGRKFSSEEINEFLKEVAK